MVAAPPTMVRDCPCNRRGKGHVLAGAIAARPARGRISGRPENGRAKAPTTAAAALRAACRCRRNHRFPGEWRRVRRPLSSAAMAALSGDESHEEQLELVRSSHSLSALSRLVDRGLCGPANAAVKLRQVGWGAGPRVTTTTCFPSSVASRSRARPSTGGWPMPSISTARIPRLTLCGLATSIS